MKRLLFLISLSGLNICACSGPNENKDHQEITGQQQQHISKDSLAAAKRVIRKDSMKAGIIKRIDSIPKSKRENNKIKREKKEIHKHLAPGQTTIDSIKKEKGEKKFNKE